MIATGTKLGVYALIAPLGSGGIEEEAAESKKAA
jgi:hypothetical protein